MKKLILLAIMLFLIHSKNLYAQWKGTTVLTTPLNVGIGTDAPKALLDLGPVGGVKFLTYGSGGTNGYQTGMGVNLGQAQNSFSLFIGGAEGTSHGASNFEVVSANEYTFPYETYTTRLAVNSRTGNVGIGTTNTFGYKLAVNGSAIFTKAVVKLYGNWPDYVFAPTYQLPSLREVKAYITQHQHLAEMPTAYDIEKDGIDLGDNQAKLLKKVEELTLYIIDLNEKMERLENEVLKKKVNGLNP